MAGYTPDGLTFAKEFALNIGAETSTVFIRKPTVAVKNFDATAAHHPELENRIWMQIVGMTQKQRGC